MHRAVEPSSFSSRFPSCSGRCGFTFLKRVTSYIVLEIAQKIRPNLLSLNRLGTRETLKKNEPAPLHVIVLLRRWKFHFCQYQRKCRLNRGKSYVIYTILRVYDISNSIIVSRYELNLFPKKKRGENKKRKTTTTTREKNAMSIKQITIIARSRPL